jgi:hypothetical protein
MPNRGPSRRSKLSVSGFRLLNMSGGRQRASALVQVCSQGAKVANFSGHCLRHTFASRLVMAGVDILTVQELSVTRPMATLCDTLTSLRSTRWQPSSGWTLLQRLRPIPLPAPECFSGLRRRWLCCSKYLSLLDLHCQRPGGGMADAEDLKSSGDFSSCGFDSHPGHHFLLCVQAITLFHPEIFPPLQFRRFLGVPNFVTT